MGVVFCWYFSRKNDLFLLRPVKLGILPIESSSMTSPNSMTSCGLTFWDNLIFTCSRADTAFSFGGGELIPFFSKFQLYFSGFRGKEGEVLPNLPLPPPPPFLRGSATNQIYHFEFRRQKIVHNFFI